MVAVGVGVYVNDPSAAKVWRPDTRQRQKTREISKIAAEALSGYRWMPHILQTNLLELLLVAGLANCAVIQTQ